MSLAFFILAVVTLGSAIAAVTLRNLVHCALCLVATFAGLAGLFLQLDAQFVGFAQILVYVGAVAILIVFAILLTRGSEVAGKGSPFSGSWAAGLLVAVLVCGSLAGATLASSKARVPRPPPPEATVKDLGVRMLKGDPRRSSANYVLPLEVVGVLLTAAMIGAAIIALPDRRSK